MTTITRRGALATGLSVTAGLLGATAAPVPKGDNKSWVGKTVLPKRSDPQGESDDPNAPFNAGGTRTRTLDSASWEVKAEKGTRVEVFENGISYWVEKDRLVLLADAVAFYTKSMKDDDGQTDGYAHNFRGWAKYLLGKPEEAVKDFDEFLKLFHLLEPPAVADRIVGLKNRGLVLAEMGKFDAAMKDFDEALKLGGTHARLNRGWAYHLKGDYKKAAEDYAAVMEAWPNDVLALNNSAWLRATCPDAAFRDGKEAVKLAKQVCERTDNREGMFLDTLAAAHAEAGDFAAAVKVQELALEDSGYTKKYGDDAQKRLALYKDKKPFRTEPLKPR